MNHGIVRWYNQNKGYGLIAPDDGSAELTVSRAAVFEAGLVFLWAGDRVVFSTGLGPDGPRACRIAVLPKAGQPSV